MAPSELAEEDFLTKTNKKNIPKNSSKAILHVPVVTSSLDTSVSAKSQPTGIKSLHELEETFFQYTKLMKEETNALKLQAHTKKAKQILRELQDQAQYSSERDLWDFRAAVHRATFLQLSATLCSSSSSSSSPSSSPSTSPSNFYLSIPSSTSSSSSPTTSPTSSPKSTTSPKFFILPSPMVSKPTYLEKEDYFEHLKTIHGPFFPGFELLGILEERRSGVFLHMQEKSSEKSFVSFITKCNLDKFTTPGKLEKGMDEGRLSIGHALGEFLCPVHQTFVKSYSETDLYLYSLLDYFPEGTLSLRLQTAREDFPELQIKHWVYCIASGLAALHRIKLIHHDLKPENIMVEKGILKVGKFGTSSHISPTSTTASTTTTTKTNSQSYLAPEQFEGASYSSAADMWSLGVILYQLLTRKSPKCFETLQDKIVLNIPSQYSSQLVELLKSLLSVDPKLRPTASYVKSLLEKQIQDTLVNTYEQALRLSFGFNKRGRLLSAFGKSTTPEHKIHHEKARSLLELTFSYGIKLKSSSLEAMKVLLGHLYLERSNWKWPPTDGVALQLFEQSTHPLRHLYLSLFYYTEKNLTQSQKLHKHALDSVASYTANPPLPTFLQQHQDTWFQYFLGFAYQKGIGVTQDEKKAINYYRLAAKRDHAQAQSQLGWCYDHGIGLPRQVSKAVHWYRLSAEQGDPIGQNNLGMRYFAGSGIPQDWKLAVRLLHSAAEQGLASAQYNLGRRYHEGEGVTKDIKEAIYWYRLSSEKGFAGAQYRLGSLYELGIGFEKNHQQAVHYYQLAAAQGYGKAKQNLEALPSS